MTLRLAACLGAFTLASIANGPAASADPGIPASPEADAAGCPTTLVLETTNDSDYALSFDGPSPLTASFELRLYGDKIDYTVSLPRVNVSVPYTSENGTKRYRSTAVDLYKNGGAFPVAATVIATNGAGAACPPEHVFIPKIRTVITEKRSKSESDLLDAMAAEIGDGTHAFALVAQPPTKFPCEAPFAAAAIVDDEAPAFSAEAKLAHATGSVRVLVTLGANDTVLGESVYESSGNSILDESALKAARDSKYSSAIFACVPAAGIYPYRADFPAN